MNVVVVYLIIVIFVIRNVLLYVISSVLCIICWFMSLSVIFCMLEIDLLGSMFVCGVCMWESSCVSIVICFWNVLENGVIVLLMCIVCSFCCLMMIWFIIVMLIVLLMLWIMLNMFDVELSCVFLILLMVIMVSVIMMNDCLILCMISDGMIMFDVVLVLRWMFIR